MEDWLVKQGHELSCTRLWAGDELPSPGSFAGIIVMGGSMSIYDYDEYPWLLREKEFLQLVVNSKIPVLGICLGAQLLADVLGAKVCANPEKEIGWFPVVRTLDVPKSLAAVLPQEFIVFHWHGDTFSLPPGSVSLYTSSICTNQAFLYDGYVLGLQFHLETTPESAVSIIENCRDELVLSPWIQEEKEMLGDENRFARNNLIMYQLLNAFFFYN